MFIFAISGLNVDIYRQLLKYWQGGNRLIKYKDSLLNVE